MKYFMNPVPPPPPVKMCFRTPMGPLIFTAQMIHMKKKSRPWRRSCSDPRFHPAARAWKTSTPAALVSSPATSVLTPGINPNQFVNRIREEYRGKTRRDSLTNSSRPTRPGKNCRGTRPAIRRGFAGRRGTNYAACSWQFGKKRSIQAPQSRPPTWSWSGRTVPPQRYEPACRGQTFHLRHLSRCRSGGRDNILRARQRRG